MNEEELFSKYLELTSHIPTYELYYSPQYNLYYKVYLSERQPASIGLEVYEHDDITWVNKKSIKEDEVINLTPQLTNYIKLMNL